MSEATPRLRMFAGPNGSGKTTVKNNLHRPSSWFGTYINPDDLERELRETGRLSCSAFNLSSATAEIQEHFSSSELLRRQQLELPTITYRDDTLDFGRTAFTAYHASVLSDFLRKQALAAAQSFSFETVMSAPDKVALLHEAQQRGFRTYLYYIATEDPAINLQRVKNRVAEGGHDVPEEKIIARYHRSLGLLEQAIRHTKRAFFFDTSEEEAWYFAEATDGNRIELKSGEMPNWFQPIWDRF